MSAARSKRSGSLDFDAVREIALSMPDVEETTAYGMPAFKAGKRRFVGTPVPRAEIEPDTIGISVSLTQRAQLLAARPDLYYITDHFANYPAVLVRLSKLKRTELRGFKNGAVFLRYERA